MKLAFLAEIVSYRSGARMPVELAKNLAKNHQIVFIAYNHHLDKDALKDLKQLKIEVILFPYFIPNFIARIYPIIPLFLYFRRNRFDFVLSHSFLPFFIAAKLACLPIIRTYHGTQLDIQLEKIFPRFPNFFDQILNYFFNLIIKTRERFFFKNSFQTVAISKYTQKEALKFYHCRIPFIYNGADSSFTYNYKKLSFQKKFSFISVSRIIPYKGFHLIIKAFKKVNNLFPHSSLTIIGSAPNLNYFNYLKKLARGKPIRILTEVTEEKLKNLFQEANIYLSADRFAFFGLPIVEAAFFKLPTITYDFAASGEIVLNKQTGWIVKNQKELERRMIMVIKNPNLVKESGQKAYERAREIFTWQKCGREYESLLSKKI